MSRSFSKSRGLLRDESGVSAMEFALIAPLFCFILVGVLEFGNILFQRFQLEGALSAGSNYALINGEQVTAAGAEALARNIAGVVNARDSVGWTGVQVTVNNSITASVPFGGATATVSGSASNAGRCFCPTSNGIVVTWGNDISCTTPAACPAPNADNVAGKFVQIRLNMPYTPILSGYGIVDNGTISVASLIRTE